MRARTLFGCLFAILFMAADPAVTLRGKVVRIFDGDTIDLLVGNETVRVRLEGIDSPESKQSFGTKSKDALKELVAGKEVVVRKTGEDRYQRTLAFVFAGEVNVNAKLVADGWAWHYKEYNKDPQLAKLEVAAREAKRGLWADKNALAPWEFRQRQKLKDQAKTDEPDTEGALIDDAAPTKKYWLNTSSNIRHNESCEYFNNTKKGRLCTAGDGKACGKCGG